MVFAAYIHPVIALSLWAGLHRVATNGWTLTALAGVCILQYLHYVNRLRKSTAVLQSEIDEAQALLSLVQKDYQLARLEAQILGEFVNEKDPDQAIRLLLKRLISDVRGGMAAYVDLIDETVSVRQCRGMLRDSRQLLEIDGEILARASSGDPFLLSGRDWRSSRLFATLTKADRSKVARLHVFGVIADQRLVGVVLATHLFPQEMAEQQQIELLQRLTRGLGDLCLSAIKLSSHRKELHRTHDILELRSISDQQFDTPVELIQAFVDLLRVKTGASRVSLYIAAVSGKVADKSFVRSGSASNPNVERQLREAEDAIAVLAHGRGETMILDRTDLLRNRIRSFITHAIGVPLLQKRATVGAISLLRESSDKFQQADIHLAEWAAEYLVGTILNALQRALVEQQARTDSLTGLANRATFDNTIETEIKTARGLGEKCSLLLLDLDHFKAINDTYGHQVGDQVLRSAAASIRESLKNNSRSDNRILAARYGGEELAVLLPQMNHPGALRIAELMRAAIAQGKSLVGQRSVNATVSIGVATFPDHATNAAGLIAAADTGLYFAKEAGRDRVGVPQSTSA